MCTLTKPFRPPAKKEIQKRRNQTDYALKTSSIYLSKYLKNNVNIDKFRHRIVFKKLTNKPMRDTFISELMNRA